MMWGWGHGAGWWVFGTIMMLVFWGGLAALIVFAVRGWGGRGGNPGGYAGPDARGILEERFARGEISKEEFEERKRVLEGGGP
jgi:putative membrane protein